MEQLLKKPARAAYVQMTCLTHQGRSYRPVKMPGSLLSGKHLGSGVPWDDRSGDEQRRWLSVIKAQFYDAGLFALVPMGFCYTRKGVTGDLPPRLGCAPLWHPSLLSCMPKVKLIILVGKYAQDYYLKTTGKQPLTETITAISLLICRLCTLLAATEYGNGKIPGLKRRS